MNYQCRIMKKKIKNRTPKYNQIGESIPPFKGAQGLACLQSNRDFVAIINTKNKEKHTPNPYQEGNVREPINTVFRNTYMTLCYLCGSKKTIKTAIIFLLTFTLATIQAQSLNTFLEKAVEHNTELKALNLQHEAEIKRADQQNQLQNPTLGIGVPVLRPETRLGAQVLMINASQMFPWFGTLKAKKDVVLQLSKAKFERISATKLQVFYKIKTAYYNLAFLNKEEEIINNYIKIYTSLENFSYAKVESGQTTSADALRIDIKLQALKQELLIIANEKRKYEIIINKETKDNLETNILIDEKSIVFENEYDLEKYREKIQNHPLIAKLNKEFEVSEQKQKLNAKKGLPTFGIGLDYSMVNKRTDANPQFNGNDILIPKLSVSIPIYRKAYKAKNEEEKLIQQSIEMQKENLTDNIISQLMQYKLAYDNALLETELTQNQIKTNNMVYEVLLAKYSSQGKGFDELLQIQNQIIAFELKLEKSKLKKRMALAGIEMLTDY